jgi:murein DD-endopeptidase MepM/ murein hydrolase activator NlpD
MNLGEDGFSLGIGSSGTDISIGTLAAAVRGLANWDKNIEIEKAAQKNEVENAAAALRVQWGFGDETALALLDEILKNETLLRGRKGGKGKAETTLENGRRVVYLNNYISGDMSREEKLAMGITLQHEAYRDGIISDDNDIETMFAVGGHTEIALRMAQDPMYGDIMKTIITGDINLQNDITAYMASLITGDRGIFAGYVDRAYDSSADYWKLMEDGRLLYDGDGYLKDPNGNLFPGKIGAAGVEAGLIKILGLSDNEKGAEIAREMMRKAGMTEKEAKVWWKHEGNEGKAITLDNKQYSEIYHDSLIQYNTFEIYKNHIASTREILNVRADSDLYPGYVKYKANNFIIGEVSYESRNTFVDKKITTFFNVYGDLSTYPHRGTDASVKKGTDSLLLFRNNTSRVAYSSADSEENKTANKNEPHGLYATIATDITYNFRGEIVTETVYFRTLHLDEVLVKTGDELSWDTVIGKTGNTGKWGTNEYGYHAHEEIYTKNLESPYLKLLTDKQNARPVISYNNNYYYDKFIFADLTKYLHIDKGAYNYNK